MLTETYIGTAKAGQVKKKKDYKLISTKFTYASNEYFVNLVYTGSLYK